MYFYSFICAFLIENFFVASCWITSFAIFLTQMITHVSFLILSYFVIFVLIVLSTSRFPISFVSNLISSLYVICQFCLAKLFSGLLLVMITLGISYISNALNISTLILSYFPILSTPLYCYTTYITNRSLLKCYNNRTLGILLNQKLFLQKVGFLYICPLYY